MTWLEFKQAVDSLLLTDSDRAGTVPGKELKVRLGAQDLQRVVDKYRKGHQDIFASTTLTPSGFASRGLLPEDCQPRDCYIVKRKSKVVSNTVDLTNDVLTVTAHGVVTPAFAVNVNVGQFRNTGGALPAGIVSGQSYYLRVVTVDTLTLHTSADGALSNTQRVDITGNGTGTTTLDHTISRFGCDTVPWADRYALIHRAACLNGMNGAITIDPQVETFLVYPAVPTGDDSLGFNWYFELNWDGEKLEWADTDLCPFDDGAVEYVAEYVAAWFARKVDQDLPAAAAAEKAAKSSKAALYLSWRAQRQQRP